MPLIIRLFARIHTKILSHMQKQGAGGSNTKRIQKTISNGEKDKGEQELHEDGSWTDGPTKSEEQHRLRYMQTWWGDWVQVEWGRVMVGGIEWKTPETEKANGGDEVQVWRRRKAGEDHRSEDRTLEMCQDADRSCRQTRLLTWPWHRCCSWICRCPF